MTELITPAPRSVISSPDTQAAIWFLGALSQVRVSGEQTGGAFSLAENVARRGNASPVHVHDRDDETFFVLDGELRVIVGEDDYTAGPGTVAVLPRWLRHAYVVTSATARFLVLHAPGGFEQFAAEVGEPAQTPTLPPEPADHPTSPRWLRQPPATASPSWPRRPRPRSGQAPDPAVIGSCSVDYDAELRLHDEVLRRTYNIRADDRVLDIGCGTGRTTRDAARSAGEGSALGVDLSASMIERARELARAERVHNVAFEQGDAQVHRFPEDGFDLAISRFGTMFFDDPVAAFANIAVALRPAGRLVMMVWQEHEHNEWSVAIERALGREGSPVPDPDSPDPFSLAEQDTVEAILGTAGFGEATFTDVHQPIYFGPDVAAALEWVGGFSSTKGLLMRLDATAAERALERLREALAAHASERGVWFDSRAWVIEARRL
jgi:SAM-dependent methyltransferase/quercetin dioxygenase-like cupin family protein